MAFAVTVDVVLFAIRVGSLCVLVVRRGAAPFRGTWALPGGFVEDDEDLAQAARRELDEETGLGELSVHVEQLATFGRPGRDPRMRVVSVAYLALAPAAPEPRAGSDAADARWAPVDELLAAPRTLAFDHAEILTAGLERLRAKIEYSPLASALCTEEFTVAELRRVYEVAWGVPLDPRNFHRKVTGAEGVLVPAGRLTTRRGGRPAQLYRRGAAELLNPPITRPQDGGHGWIRFDGKPREVAMEPVEGARTFLTSAEDYDNFMGRYSRPLARAFADWVALAPGQSALDVGCGTGALTAELANRLGPESVCAVDPSPPFVRHCAAANPGVEVRDGQAEALPFGDGMFDVTLAQLVLHFVSDPAGAAGEMRRVTRPGGKVAACVWDFAEEMRMLRLFWDAAAALDPDAPDEARTLRFGCEGEITELFAVTGLRDIRESTLVVESTYRDFDELWAGYLCGIGPAGTYCVSLAADARERLRAELLRRVDAPQGAFTLTATARVACGIVPAA